MAWPTDDISTVNLDAGTDDPSQARADLLNALNRLKEVIAGRATADGVCELDANALVPVARLPNGSGNGIDADTLDGQDGSYYLAAAAYTAADVLAKLLTVDGSGSGLDADLLDGNEASAFASASHSHDSATYTTSGFVELATSAEVQAGTDSARVPSVNTMKYHDGIAKAWVNFNGEGTPAIRKSFNVSSITDNGTGDYTINFATAMADAYYAIVISAGDSTYDSARVSLEGATYTSTTGCRIQIENYSASPADYDMITAVVFD